MKASETVKSYLRFMIDRKQVKGQSWKNRPASDFYRLLRQNANRYGVSIYDVLNQQAEFVMNGKYVSLL